MHRGSGGPYVGPYAEVALSSRWSSQGFAELAPCMAAAFLGVFSALSASEPLNNNSLSLLGCSSVCLL